MDIPTITASGVLAVLIQVVAWFWLKERLSRSIKHEYDIHIEKFKHDLELELDKKKRLYEGKLVQYKKYYQFIDESSKGARSELFSDLGEKFIRLINDPSNENSIEYIRSIFASQKDINDRFLIFKTEINGLRLEAGEHLLQMLDLYSESLAQVQKVTVEFMRQLNQNPERFLIDNETMQKEISEFQQNLELGPGAKTKELKEKIFWEMRRELGIV